jgi:hypothetical protein
MVTCDYILHIPTDHSAPSAWHFYSQTQIPELNALRIGFLLRLLIVDTKPFENLLEEVLHKYSTWENRFVDSNECALSTFLIINADLKGSLVFSV